MKKRIIGFILTVFLILPCAFMLSACGKDYTISFEENGGSIVKDITQKNGSSLLPPTNPSKDGYSFGGWFLSENFSGTNFIFSKMPNENKTLYAKWNLVYYNISYELDGGFNHADNPTTYNIESDTFTLQAPTKTGFVFAGWTGSNILSAQTELTFPKGTFGELSLTANWTISKYNVSFAINDSTYGFVNMHSLSSIEFDTAISANGNALTIGENVITAISSTATNQYTYKFKEWQIKYENGDYANLMDTDKVTNNVEIKAVFQREITKHNVYWKNYDGTLLETDNVNYGTLAYYNEGTPTKPQTYSTIYKFLGWNLIQATESTLFTNNTSEIIARETTYYAIFTGEDRIYTADIEISSDGEDVFGIIYNYASSSYTYGPGGSQGDTVDIKYGAHIEAKADNTLEVSDAPAFVARAKEATEDYTYTFMYWQIVSNGQTINLPYDSENTINNCLASNYAIITSIKAVFERINGPKENNGTLVLKINDEDVNSPYTYAGETYELSATGNLGTAANKFTVENGTGVATISGNKLTVTKAGTLTIKVNNAGDGRYLPATETSVVITIDKGNSSISYLQGILTKGKWDKFTNPLTNQHNVAVTYEKNCLNKNVFNLNTTTGEVYIKDETTDVLGVAANISGNDLWKDCRVNYVFIVVPDVTLNIRNGLSYHSYPDWLEEDKYDEETYDGVTFEFSTVSNARLNNVVFSIVSGGTGEATIEGEILTLTKAGTITIRIEAEGGTFNGNEFIKTYSDYSHDFTIKFNKGQIGGWNEDIQTGGVSLFDYDEDAFITTQSTNFTAIACVFDTTVQLPAIYSSSDTSIATVNSATGEVTIHGESGQTVEITATINFADDDLWEDLTNYTITYTLTIG